MVYKILKLVGVFLVFLLIMLASSADYPLKITFEKDKVTIGQTTHSVLAGEARSEGNASFKSFGLRKRANFLVYPDTAVTSASELMNSIPGCTAISMWNDSSKRWEGWISARGGRGKNFTVKPGSIYEVFVAEDSSLTVKIE